MNIKLAIRVAIVGLGCLGMASAAAAATNSIGIDMVTVPAGKFEMGNPNGEFDERPLHWVEIKNSFAISAREVSNSQFEQFQPEHKSMRGRDGTSASNEAPVFFVSWEDASAFCRWLGEREQKIYRLPTEAEWEYACKTKPELFRLQAGNAEDWCYDWYGPYPASSQVDPVGYAAGDVRVVRGGEYMSVSGQVSSVNRLGNIPDDRNRVVSFRLVEGKLPETPPLRERPAPLWARDVSRQKFAWKPAVDMSKPFFAEPKHFVKIAPADNKGPLFSKHNHDPAITWCVNGDMFAVWYTTMTEPGRELAIAASRLRQGSNEWDDADLFWDVPDRNDHASGLWTDNSGKMFHFNGHGVGTGWRDLALVMRTSSDNGVTWDKPVLINPVHGQRNQTVASVFGAKDGAIVVPCDASPKGYGGTALHISRDGGLTWIDPGNGKPVPVFAEGKTGAWIAGIHAGVDECDDGAWVALGRGNDIDGRMPMSVSRDQGQTWTYSASPFPPVSGGQRLVLRKLREGPLMLISFSSGKPGKDAAGKEIPAMTFTNSAGVAFTGQGMYAALSYDSGRTWPVRKLLTDGIKRELNGQGWTKQFVMDATHAEPKGYLSAIQTPDGMIHLISSGVHYRFNLAWLKEPNKAPPENAP